MRYVTKLIVPLTSATYYLFFNAKVYAQSKPLIKDPAKIGSDIKVENIPQLVIQYIFYLAIFLAVVYLMFGGIKLLTSGGEKEKVADGRKHITYAVVGLIVVLGTFFILNIIFSIVGADNPLNKNFQLPTLKNIGK